MNPDPDTYKPGRVDIDAIIAFIGSLDKHEWLIPLLHKSLELQLSAEKRR